MNMREPAPISETPLGQDLLHALRYYLGGRRAWLALAALLGLAGLVLNWSWLVAVGVAPLLIALSPCVAMCALGLCMNRKKGGSRSSDDVRQASARPEADASLRRGPAIPPLVLVDDPDQPMTEAEDPESTEYDPEFAQLGADNSTVSDGLTATTTEKS